MKERRNDKDKGSNGKTSAHDRLANQAETVVPSAVSVSTESTGIMGAVTRGKSTASDIQQVLSHAGSSYRQPRRILCSRRW